LRKTLTVVLSLFVLALVGCTNVEEVKSDAQPQKKEEPKVEDKVYQVGEKLKVNGVEIVITKASFSAPQQFTAPKNGKVLTLEVDFNNQSETQVFVDNTEFNIYTKDGNKLEPYFGYEELALTGEINKGKKLSGKLYFDVKEADSYELIYKPMFTLDNKEVKFNIKPTK
jgi:uncharacterized lipoprotein NlpE involved in copper resistance